jgi:hypothetical protein
VRSLIIRFKIINVDINTDIGMMREKRSGRVRRESLKNIFIDAFVLRTSSTNLRDCKIQIAAIKTIPRDRDVSKIFIKR